MQSGYQLGLKNFAIAEELVKKWKINNNKRPLNKKVTASNEYVINLKPMALKRNEGRKIKFIEQRT